jgi:hypothetical protein
VAEHDEVLDKQCLNLPSLLMDCEESHYDKHGCDVTYLILAYLFIIDRPTTFKNLADDLRAVGVTPEEVRDHVFRLYHLKDKELGNVIWVWNDDEIKSELNLRDGTVLELNYRGTRLVEHVSCAFTFVNVLLMGTPLYSKGSRERNQGSYYDLRNYHLHSLENVNFLARVARLHAIELIRISKRMNMGSRWLHAYSRKLCIRGSLQLPRIIDSHCAFLRHLAPVLEGQDRKNVELHMAVLKTLKDAYKQDARRINPNSHAIYDYERIAEVMLGGEKPDLGTCQDDVTKYL